MRTGINNQLSANQRQISNINIPSSCLVGILYTPTQGITELAACLLQGKPCGRSIYYCERKLPCHSIRVVFLRQECFGLSAQVKRIVEAIHNGNKIILVSNMTEGLSPDKAHILCSTVQQLCMEYQVTVINEEYHEDALQKYTHLLGDANKASSEETTNNEHT